MKNMILRGIVVGPVQTNCYFLKNRETEEIVIVDPGAEEHRIVQALNQLGGTPVAVLLTHGHYDHMEAAEEIKAHYGIPIYAPAAEEKLLKSPEMNLSAGWSRTPRSIKADRWLSDGERWKLAGFSMEMILSPGHTSGSCCYWISEEEVCFSGDTIFYTNCGRTDLPTGSMADMKKSLNKVLGLLPAGTLIYPGHGEETEAGFEKRENPYL